MTTAAHTTHGSTEDKTLADVHSAIQKMAGHTEAVGRRIERPSFARILLCYDGTPASAHALEWAAHLAAMHAAHVVVASIVPPDRVSASPWAMAYAVPVLEDHRNLVARMRALADDAASDLRGRGIDAESISVEGEPAREIASIARTQRADLVVLGAKSSGSIRRALLGSTAESILGRVDASVLVARAPPRPHIIHVATDGSAPSHRAVAAALRYASHTRADVTVQHVLDTHEDVQALPPEGFLKGVIDKLDLPTPPHVKYVLDAGRPAHEIVKRAEAEHADLIVVGARGLGRITGALLGSVSHRVANASHANVLVVREKE